MNKIKQNFKTLSPQWMRVMAFALLTIVSLGLSTQVAKAVTCALAQVIPAAPTLPLTLTNVCNGLNQITSANSTTCGSGSYKGGQEAVYVWTPTGSYTGVTVLSTGQTWSGITFYQGCPTTGGTCLGSIASSAASKTLSVAGTITGGTTYYIVIDTWPSPPSACPGTITLNGTLQALCTGTPAPGNTLATVTTGCGTASTLSVQNATSGTGVTRQWQSADDAAFTTNVVNLGTAATQGVNLPVTAQFYRCNVTCGANTGSSNPISLVSTAPLPVGATIASNGGLACSGVNFTLSLTTPQTAGTYSYQWESADDAGFTVNLTSLGTAATQVTSQTAAKFYRCNVSCPALGVTQTSTPISVTMNTWFNCYCTAVPLNVDVNGITNVEMGTLSNPNVSTSTYQDFTVSVAAPVFTKGTTVPVTISYQTGYTYGTRVFIDFNQDGDFADIDENIYIGVSSSANPTSISGSVPIPATALTGFTRMRVIGTDDDFANNPCYSSSWANVEDYKVDIQPNVNCAGVSPQGQTISTSGASVCAGVPFTLSVTTPAIGNGISYEWQSSPNASFVPFTVLGTGITQTIASQSAASYYRCVTTCSFGGSDISTEVFVGQNAATACYCIPQAVNPYSYGCAQSDVIANVEILDGTTILYGNNSGVGCPSDPCPVTCNDNFTFGALNGNGYSDYTGLGSVVNLQAGNTYACKVSAGAYAENYAAWIDYNDDGFFAPTERIGFSPTTVQANNSASFPITLDCSPPSGAHRLRVKCAFGFGNGSTIDPCVTYTYMETEDYIITVDPALSCPAPSSFAVSLPTSNGATFSWNKGCDEQNWVVEYGATGYTAGTGTSIPVSSPTLVPNFTTVVNTMPCGSTFDVYIKADCDPTTGGGFSTWVGPISVTTDPCPCPGAPALANTVSSTAAACPNAPFTLSLDVSYTNLTGITYQWQSSADQAFTAPVNLGTGATEFVFAGQTTATYYRCIVTCSSGPASTPSTEVLVGMNTAFFSCYCSTNLHSFAGPCIDEISINTLTNNTAVPTCALPAYSVTPAATATTSLEQGGTYTITRVASGTGAWTGVWIDYDQSGTFDVSEYTEISTTFTGALTNSASITIPIGATLGQTGMRIRQRVVDQGAGDACLQGFGSGETEDYIVSIIAPAPCVAPTPGNTVSSAPYVCNATATVNLSLSTPTPGLGVSYLWESADDAGFSVNAAILPSTTSTASVTQAAPKYYRCTVTCATGPASAASVPVFVDFISAPLGSSITNPIVIGQVPCSAVGGYTDTKTNTLANCFVDNYVSPFTFNGGSPDVWYQFTLSATSVVEIAHCASAFDTYVSLLDATGTEIDSDDDDCPLNMGAFLTSAPLAPGTYYIVSTGYGGNTGAITTQVSIPSGTPIISGITACDTYTWPFNGVTYTVSGTYFDNVNCSDGTLNLVIEPSTSNTTTATGCPDYTWSVNGVTYNASGTYTNVVGCNTEILNLTIACNNVLTVTAFIEGYLDAALSPTIEMRPVKFNQSVSASLTECDDITVELYASPYTIGDPAVATSTALLSVSGTGTATFSPPVVAGNYYVRLVHRTAVPTWSATPVAIAATGTVNFTVAGAIAGGNGYDIDGGTTFAMFSGDIAPNDGSVDNNDFSLWEADANDFLAGYLATDLNGDGSTENNDFTLWETNSNNFVAEVTP